MKKLFTSIFITTSVALSGCASKAIETQSTHAPEYESLAKPVSSMAVRKMTINDVPGLSVAITNSDKIIYLGAFGFANQPANSTITNETEFRIGSISKLLTATAIMQLYESGQLDLDASVLAYLPEFSINSVQGTGSITIRAMLSHMSGLPTDMQAGFLSYEADEQLLELLSNSYVASQPFTVKSYSNIAYNLLGRVIEQVSGLSYEQYVHLNLFEPLNMTSASLGQSENIAAGHAEGQTTPFVEVRDQSAGDMTMTIRDLAQFAKASLNNGAGVLQEQTFKHMIAPQGERLVFQSNAKQGLGWILGFPGDYLAGVGNIIWHDGSIGSFRSVMLVDLDSGLAVAVLANSQEGSSAIYQIAEQAMILAIKQNGGSVEKEINAPTWSKERVPFTPEQLITLPGDYVSNTHGELTIKRKGDRLVANVAMDTVKLQAYSDGLIGADYHLFSLIPLDLDAVNGHRFRQRTFNGQKLIEQLGVGVVAEKLAGNVLSTDWINRLGNYELTSADGGIVYQNVRLEEHKGIIRMFATATMSGNAAFDIEAFIRPVSNNRAVIVGYGRSLGDSLIFDDTGRFVYSGFKFKKVSE